MGCWYSILGWNCFQTLVVQIAGETELFLEGSSLRLISWIVLRQPVNNGAFAFCSDLFSDERCQLFLLRWLCTYCRHSLWVSRKSTSRSLLWLNWLGLGGRLAIDGRLRDALINFGVRNASLGGLRLDVVEKLLLINVCVIVAA